MTSTQYNIPQPQNFAEWRDSARALVIANIPPEAVTWSSPASFQKSLFDNGPDVLPPPVARGQDELRVSPNFLEMAERVSVHRNVQKWQLLYRLLWRYHSGEKRLLDDLADDDVITASQMVRQVKRDIHKMHAFVRFQKIEGAESFVAWHAPDHFIVPLATPFFARRFSTMTWSIMTPDASAHWDGSKLSYGDGVPREAKPLKGDALEYLWLTYYSSIFNPARVKIRMMKSEMPVRHWSTLPETAIIGRMLEEAPRRVEQMLALNQVSTKDFVPEDATVADISAAIHDCKRCPLARTRAVGGEGPVDAEIVIIGEQPGDMEEKVGRPFVGPAGKLLDDALQASGISRSVVYLTNTVKHFSHEVVEHPSQGKMRLHKTPTSGEVATCKGWLDAELKRIRPKIVVCLGLTAAQSLLGIAVKLGSVRGKWLRSRWTDHTIVAMHPAAILRASPHDRESLFLQLVADLKLVASVMTSRGLIAN